eukprot:1496161-Karenia_brevis.AAC.1
MEEIKILYRAMNRSGGDLSRQSGEFIMNFTKTRERARLLLKQMKPEIQMDDELRGHLLFDSAGLTKTQVLLLKASIQNDMNIDKISKALHQQCSNIRSTSGDGLRTSSSRKT